MKDKNKDSTGGSEVWLKHTGTSAVLNFTIGEIPGGAVFKTSAEQAKNMPSDMFRPATQEEVDGHLNALQTEGAATPTGSKNKKVK